MTTENLKEIIKRELPALLRSDHALRQFILNLTRETYADRRQTEDRFDRILDELRHDREAQARKWEEQTRKWDEQARRWNEQARKGDEQNLKWEESGQRALAGEEVIIARNNKPTVRLEVLPEAQRKRKLGALQNLVKFMADDFDEPFTQRRLRAERRELAAAKTAPGRRAVWAVAGAPSER